MLYRSSGRGLHNLCWMYSVKIIINMYKNIVVIYRILVYNKIIILVIGEKRVNSLGIRVTPKCIYFAIVKADKDITLKVVDKIIIPVCMDIPDQLCFVRTTVFSVIREYDIKHAGIRRIEDNLPVKKLNPIITRAYFEGVIQELISNCSIERYFSGKIQTVAKLLSQPSDIVKQLFDGNKNLFNINKWDEYTKEERECISCAIAAIGI